MEYKSIDFVGYFSLILTAVSVVGCCDIQCHSLGEDKPIQRGTPLYATNEVDPHGWRIEATTGVSQSATARSGSRTGQGV